MAQHEQPGPRRGRLRSLTAGHAAGPLYGQLLQLTDVVDAVSILSLGQVATHQPAGWRAFPAARH